MHSKQNKVSKNDADVWWSNSVSNTLLPGSYKFLIVSFRAAHNQSESTSINVIDSTAQDWHKKNISKWVFLDVREKNPALREQFVFPEFCKCVCLFPSFWMTIVFLSTRPSLALDLHSLILKDEVIPAIKDTSYESEPQMVSKTAWNKIKITNSFFFG